MIFGGRILSLAKDHSDGGSLAGEYSHSLRRCYVLRMRIASLAPSSWHYSHAVFHATILAAISVVCAAFRQPRITIRGVECAHPNAQTGRLTFVAQSREIFALTIREQTLR